MSNNKKLVLAYSGGLDTSVLVHWLSQQGYEVYGILVNLGQKVEDLEAIKAKGKKSGAVEVVVDDVREEFVRDFVFLLIQANAVYEGTYLLGTSIARPLIAQRQIELANKVGAAAVAHGATGKGNDQVRFELTYYALRPGIQVIAPWRDPAFFQKFPGRSELLQYAKDNGIPVKATASKPWSSDENILHISFEAGVLEDPWAKPPADMFELSQSPQNAPDKTTEVLIEFENGIPTKVDGKALSPAALLSRLNEIGGENGIGRVDMVESRFVGMKSRGVYETPGGTILHTAHRAMESITLDREVIHLKDSLMPRFARLVYYGFWFSPEARVLKAMIAESQKDVSGEVRLELYKGNCMVTGRRSPRSLYNADIASMEKDQGGYDPRDATGFIKLNALPLKAQSQRERKA